MTKFKWASILLLAALAVVPIAAKAVDISRSDVWSETDASNTSSTEPGFPEGMAPSRVNDAARAVMGAMRRWFVQIQPTVAATGSAGTYNMSWSVQPATVANGQIFGFWANHTNSGAATGNVHGLATRAIVKASTAGLVPLAATNIAANAFYLVAATGSQLQLLNPALIVERGNWTPMIIGSSVTGTQTYTAQAGRYERIGNRVWVRANIIVAATDAAMAGQVLLANLPYPVEGGTGDPGSITLWNNINFTSGYNALGVQFSAAGATTATLHQSGSGNTSTTLVPTNIGANMRLQIGGSYGIAE